MPPQKRERGIVINEETTSPSKNRRKKSPKGGKGKSKKPISQVPEHISSTEGEYFDSQGSLFEQDDDKPLHSWRQKIHARSCPNSLRVLEDTPYAVDTVPFPAMTKVQMLSP